MSHNVETMFSVREVPWHGLGTIVADQLTAKEALVTAGLDWEVELFPVRAEVPVEFAQKHDFKVNVGGAPHYLDVDDQFVVVRDSDLSPLGIVGGRYTPVQNWKSFEFFDTVVADGEAKYETAGSLQGGRRVWMTAKVPREILIGGEDAVDLYLLMANSHDGTSSFIAAVTPVRVVCANTLNLALSRTVQQQWRLRHTDSIDGKIAEARQALGLTFKYADEFEQKMNDLLDSEFTKAQFERLVKDVFPDKKADTARPFTDEQYAMIGVLESSPTIPDGMRYTKWGALNAVREYEDWGRTYRSSDAKSEAERRTEAVWFGRNVERANKVYAALTAN